MGGPVVLEAERRVHCRSVVQRVPVHVLAGAVGHVRAQLLERVAIPVQAGPVVRDFLADPGRYVRQGVGRHHDPVQGRGDVPQRTERVQVQIDRHRVRSVLADFGRGDEELRDVHVGRRLHLPDHNRAGQHEQLVLLVPPRDRCRRIAVGLQRVLLHSEPEHVLHRDPVRHAVLQDLHQVPRRQRRPEEAEGEERGPRQVSVRRRRRGDRVQDGPGQIAAAVRGLVPQRLLPAEVQQPSDGQHHRDTTHQALVDPPVHRLSEQHVRHSHGAVGVLFVAGRSVRHLLRDFPQLSV